MEDFIIPTQTDSLPGQEAFVTLLSTSKKHTPLFGPGSTLEARCAPERMCAQIDLFVHVFTNRMQKARSVLWMRRSCLSNYWTSVSGGRLTSSWSNGREDRRPGALLHRLFSSNRCCTVQPIAAGTEAQSVGVFIFITLWFN